MMAAAIAVGWGHTLGGGASGWDWWSGALAVVAIVFIRFGLRRALTIPIVVACLLAGPVLGWTVHSLGVPLSISLLSLACLAARAFVRPHAS